MRKFFLLFFIAAATAACAQKQDDIINAKEVQRIESALASDEMRGRRAGTPDIDRAAAFIADEFKKTGLQTIKGNSFLQAFSMVRPQLKNLKAKIDGVEINPTNVIVNTFDEEVKIDEKS